MAPGPDSEGPIPSKLLPIEDFLGPIFELGGIKASKRISLFVYASSGGYSQSVRIVTFQRFLRVLNSSIGTYQFVLNEPEIEGLDSQPFKINFLSINFEYDPKRGFYNPDVHSDIEEIWPETGGPGKIRERSAKLMGKVMQVLEFVSLFKEIAHMAGLG
jgi:hypothetical protein